jgi:hypothetical protein
MAVELEEEDEAIHTSKELREYNEEATKVDKRQMVKQCDKEVARNRDGGGLRKTRYKSVKKQKIVSFRCIIILSKQRWRMRCSKRHILRALALISTLSLIRFSERSKNLAGIA